MDKTVIILIGAGVCCVVIGIALFAKLCTTKSNDGEGAVDQKNLLDDDYTENFQNCFSNTGNIEDTLDQLAHIYTGNQYMYNLIVNALDYIKDGQGDYETALDGINVDSDITIMKMHNAAIAKALGSDSHIESEIYANPASESQPAEIHPESEDAEEEFDEDETEELNSAAIKEQNTENTFSECQSLEAPENDSSAKHMFEHRESLQSPISNTDENDDELDDLKIG